MTHKTLKKNNIYVVFTMLARCLSTIDSGVRFFRFCFIPLFVASVGTVVVSSKSVKQFNIAVDCTHLY
jgi:hypothetical protein